MRPDSTGVPRDDRGFALIAVVMLMAIFFALGISLLFLSSTERVSAVNEQDYLRAFGYAEAGLAWAEREVKDAASMTALLTGPNGSSTADDNLIGLRDLSLTATSQFTSSNEGTASAIVKRDFFGDGGRNYEALRLAAGNGVRANLFVRVDDNWDDDPTDPTKNNNLSDADKAVKVTVIAEYPIFVSDSGVESGGPRSPAQRVLVAEFAGGSTQLPAIASNDDITMGGSPKVCGDCGSLHSNADLTLGGSVCKDATATGSVGGSATVGGTKAGGKPWVDLPIINPFDDVFVPLPESFDWSSASTAHLKCGPPTAADPGNSKYFALVTNDKKGLVYKAYWDFTNKRWSWRMIDDLDDGTNTQLDDCGRVSGDANYAGGVNDGKTDEFYGFKNAALVSKQGCSACTSSGKDQTLCAIGNNDFVVNGYYEYGTGTKKTSFTGSSLTALPGSFEADTKLDYDPANWHKDGKWDFGASRVYSPVWGAVIFVYSNLKISGNPGHPSAKDYCSKAGCGSTFPDNTWRVSFIAYNDVELSGNMSLGPANPKGDYYFQVIAGRDIFISGNPHEGITPCSSGCPGTTPASIETLAGVMAAHEQIQISGNPTLFGITFSEDAIECSQLMNQSGKGLDINGDPNVFYDCQHPPNPWDTAADPERVSWREVE